MFALLPLAILPMRVSSFLSACLPCVSLRLLGGAALALCLAQPQPGRAQLVLNEVCADNEQAVFSPVGTTPDYVEIYNPGATSVTLAGWSLSDNPDRADKYKFPSSVAIPANGFVVLWLDPMPAPHLWTTNFTLKASGESLGLYYTNTLVDGLLFGPQLADRPLVRVPDGSGPWQLGLASPSAANSSLAATNFGSLHAVRINEWLATNSLGPQFDWLELYNPSTNGIVDISLCAITDALTNLLAPNVRPLSFIAAGDRFQFWCNDATNEGNELPIKLSSSSGEILSFYAPDLFTLIDRVSFGPQSGDVSMGRLPDGGPAFFQFVGTNNMTPGNANQWESLTNIVINEVLTAATSPLEDAIELFNPNPFPVDISHWYLSDSEEFPLKFRIPAGTVLPALGFKVFYEQNQSNGASSTPGFNRSGSGRAPDFSLDAVHGTDVLLTEGVASGTVTGRRNVKVLESAASGVSFGRHVKSDGGSDLVPMAARTFGADSPSTVGAFRLGTGRSNAYPMVGPLIITEIHYHPPEIGTNDNTLDEFVELRSTTNGTLRLYDPNYPTNVWRVRGGIQYDFPTNQSLAAASRLLLVNFDPATNAPQLAGFRSQFNVPTNIPIFGPYLGKLKNSQDTVELQRPEGVMLPPRPDAGYVPRSIVERLKYEDDMGWTSLADGTGLSLQRLTLSGYGNDHTNWYGAPPTAGTVNAPGIPPGIVTPPSSLQAIQGASASLSVTASGSAPLHYLWSHAGTNLQAPDGATLSLPALSPADAGSYRVVVTNFFGTATSAVATLTVLMPPAIDSPPSSLTATVGETIQFQVGASGTAPLGFQWRRGGLPLAGRTNVTLSVGPLLLSDAGAYDVVVANPYGSVTSAVATLTVGGIAPVITLQPASQSVAANATVTLTVAAYGTPAPAFFWRINGEPIAGAQGPTLVLANIHPLQSGQYDVVVSNVLGTTVSTPATINVGYPPMILLPPSDQMVSQGDSTLLLVIADGTPTLHYQWQCNGTNMPGETGPLISLNNITTSQAGIYTVVVSNDFGTVVSDPVRLTVLGPPRLVMSPLAPNGASRLSLHGSVGLTYEVEATEALGPPVWTLLRRFTLTNDLGVEDLIDEAATNLHKRFYRGKLIQP
ncbi:MAG: hypothetical protein RJA22_1389 [Verrucomicrobiota bacterium]